MHNRNHRSDDGHLKAWLPETEHDYDDLYNVAEAELAETQSKRDYDEATDAMRHRHDAVMARLCGPATYSTTDLDTVSA